MEAAPFHHDIAAAPDGAAAFWFRTVDGVRLRLGRLAPAPQNALGTVLLFPGRTEFLEKYGPAATELQARGFACASIDWRGQGLSDRLLDDPATGHVAAFADYQIDVAALLDFAQVEGLPAPYFLLAHSMGGAIGLRALHDALPVAAAAFSAPMWDVALPANSRPLVHMIALTARTFGQGNRYMPSTDSTSYVREAPFANNTLTTDPEMFAWMQRQLAAAPGFALGGPSIDWLDDALREGRVLTRMKPPDLPCLTWMGSNERIVGKEAIRRLMGRWPGGVLTEVPGAEHELMMEVPATRIAFFDACASHFAAALPSATGEPR
ncbi:alpha/beta fold hydrolase [Tropicimonas marinistellae]|uniref:alpha/beta fold hydrolase n=1 Tax=Tropicimonas marinistellae TaxID=1739787 RepID=UPI00082DB8ED|nr:alpha/beta hydrolase [Tropicimonas marinistellae]